jgi:hypothetical protein
MIGQGLGWSAIEQGIRDLDPVRGPQGLGGRLEILGHLVPQLLLESGIGYRLLTTPGEKRKLLHDCRQVNRCATSVGNRGGDRKGLLGDARAIEWDQEEVSGIFSSTGRPAGLRGCHRVLLSPPKIT